jgi:hypothetical protein
LKVTPGEQVEDRISGLEDKIDIKEKNKQIEEFLGKRLKSCERNMKELKRPNLQIMDIKGEEVQVKGIHNVFNKIIPEKLPNLKKEIPIQVQQASRTPNRHDQKRTSPQHIIVKTITKKTKRTKKEH